MNRRNRTACVSAVVACTLQIALRSLPVVVPATAFAQDEAALVDREEAAFKAAAERVAPSVVQIRTIGGFDAVEGSLVADGPTTGLIISPDGYVLSSAFNFVQKPASIVVTFASGKQTPAELIATDHSRMIVLLKATGVAELPVPEIAPAAGARVGQWAVAVGRTFRADRTNVTVGIVSAVNRMFGKAIQTDADVSTTNYGGPLVDLQGRVVGLIVPMAPQATSEVAGVEWYDSGIGFAVPLAPLAERLERMKTGEDQRPGLLGIGMRPANPHAASPELSVVRPDSPAGKAGLKTGDRIIELNSKPIASQTDLRFALGSLYAGDTVRLVATRGDDRLERSLSLVAEMPVFRHAFLGILPIRNSIEEAASAHPGKDGGSPANGLKTEHESPARPTAKQADGVVVRMVYPESPAAQAGLRPGDRLTALNEAKIDSVDDAIQAANNMAVGTRVALSLMRGDQPLRFEITAAQLPTEVPSQLPLALSEPADAAANALRAVGKTTDLRLPEFPHDCRVYVPAGSSAGRPLGVVLWIESTAGGKPDDVIRKWQSICDRDGVVLIVPTPKNAAHWERTDLEYLHRLLQRVTSTHRIDPRRVVVGGVGNTGAIAWPLALASRDVVRGIITVAAVLPRQARVPANDPSRRLAVFAAIPPQKDTAAVMVQGLKSVADAGYNVSTLTTNDITGNLTELNLEELARWIDTLDRF